MPNGDHLSTILVLPFRGGVLQIIGNTAWRATYRLPSLKILGTIGVSEELSLEISCWDLCESGGHGLPGVDYKARQTSNKCTCFKRMHDMIFSHS